MHLRFRESVVGCVINRRGEILLVERARPRGHWQFPQGGREAGETPAQAVLREMAEELGTSRLTVVGQSRPGVHRYVWKQVHAREDAAGLKRQYGYKGQRQTVLYLKFSGDDADIAVDNREHVAWRWVARADLLKAIHPLRRRVAAIALKDLTRLGL